jgi:uncharacterized protein (TIGR02996 family)
MTDASALLAAVRADPADDAPRLVYADWLDEHGQPERAEFIRVQCELARRDDPALRRREAELVAAHHDNLAGPLAAPHLRFRFERGFPVAFGHAGLFIREPGLGRGARRCYRFGWDFTWAGISGPETGQRALAAMSREFGQSTRTPRSRYRFDAFQTPAAIWLGLEVTPSGFLSIDRSAGLLPILEVIDRSPGRESMERFDLVEVEPASAFLDFFLPET